ncbi:MAG TPA: hypothetical protein VHD87_02175 [Acidimicrobiales bacterium]|nr:hypothetical protein [Acidimicrobiales bacterium]
MTLVRVAPALFALAVAACGAPVARRRIAPALAARLLTLIAVSVAVSVVGAAVLLATGAGGPAGLGRWLAWCRQSVPSHDAIPTPSTIAGMVLLGAMGVGVWRFVRRSRRAAARWGRPDGLQVVDLADPAAYTVRGASGQGVVSTGLLRELSARQQRALFDHEKARMRLRHSRYVRLVSVSAAAVPLLRPVAELVRLATARWADEIAAAAVGNRADVATAIARAAAAGAPAVSLDGSDVATRVQALLEAPPSRQSRWRSTIALALVAVTCLAAAGLQLRGLVEYGLHICGAG